MQFTGVKIAYRTIFFFAITFYQLVYGGKPIEALQENKPILRKVSINDTYTAMTINNIFSYYTNNGDGSLNPFTGDGGFELLNSNRGISVFEEGFLWGGIHRKDDKIRIGGSYYTHGLEAGKILTAGTSATPPVADDPLKKNNRIYKVRPDVGPGNPFNAGMESMLVEQDVAAYKKYENYTAKQLYDKYVLDWNEWPAADGAPFDDKDGNGQYDPAVDIPGIPGADQTIWYVANDLDSSRTFYLAGGDPIGVEFQRTIWAYRRNGVIGNTIFQKNIIINKSGYSIDSMYVAQWVDPDLGGGLGYKDDFVGCDTLLNLGFVYNGDSNDGFFGTKPPSTGFDLLQGPLVPGLPSDSGRYKGRYYSGKKNIGMTAFPLILKTHTPYEDPRINDPRALLEWYSLMRGLLARTGGKIIDPTTNKEMKYAFPGDPVSKTGWIDGSMEPPGDRRFVICSGPFTMANSDTQEIIFAGITGLGSDWLSSVTVLKRYDTLIQSTFNNNFDLPTPPAAPIVKTAELDNEIILNWGEPESVRKTESQHENGYTFQGYKIYQLPGREFLNEKLFATYDLKDGILNIKDWVLDESTSDFIYKTVVFGSDNGIVRSLDITRDSLTGNRLVNGKKYYFAVTAYNYIPNPPDGFPKTLESTPVVIEVVPQSPKPGVTYSFKVGDLMAITHTGGSDGSVVARVVDPTILDGHSYQIGFDTTGDSATWKLTDATVNKILISGQYQFPAGTNQSSYIINGFQIDAFGPSKDAKDFQHVSNLSGPITPPSYAAWSAINGLKFPDPSWQGNSKADWGGGTWGINQGGGVDGSYATFKSRVFRGTNFSRFVPYDFEMRFTPAGGKAYLALTTGAIINVPFELWNIGINTPNDPSDDFRMIPWVNDADGDGKFGLQKADHPLSGSDNDPYTDWIYWMEPNPKTPGTAGYDAFVAAGAGYDGTQGTGAEVMARMVLVNLNGGSISDPLFPANVNSMMPATGNVIRILSTKPNGVNDVFSFTATAPKFSAELAKTDVAKINVFPNPYFGFNEGELRSASQHVTFTHLPRQATISIVNLGGVRVRKLIKDNDSQFLEWDLLNESGWLVAAGIYVAYIDMGTYGTKLLKLSIIPERPFPYH